MGADFPVKNRTGRQTESEYMRKSATDFTLIFGRLYSGFFPVLGQNSLQKTMHGGKANQSKRSRFWMVPCGPGISRDRIRYSDFGGSKSTEFLVKIGVGRKKSDFAVVAGQSAVVPISLTCFLPKTLQKLGYDGKPDQSKLFFCDSDSKIWGHREPPFMVV